MKIKVTRKQYNRIITAYRLSMFAVIILLLVLYSILIDRIIEFCFMFIVYFISKNLYSKQYHSNSLKTCFILSLLVFAISITVCINIKYSIIYAAVFGAVIAYVSYIAGDIKEKLAEYKILKADAISRAEFNTTTCSEEQLLNRCKELGLTEEQTEFCINAFIHKMHAKDMADLYCMEVQSIKNKKQYYKKKLNNL